ncbi:MAG: type II toxin-antitoxin system VapC family toxin [Armatimonadetes bacterium]|nr:type II toxin-antitoxin system VapC family toxin [Armatimonadota bacterium]
MILHLDTHTFLWFAWGDTRLPVATRNHITDPANTVCVSIVSLWEIALKSSPSKLTVELPLADFFTKNVDGNGFGVLPVTRAHLLAVHGLPFHHRDPLDRLLIAQSLSDSMTFVSGDAQIAAYGVPVLWQ